MIINRGAVCTEAASGSPPSTRATAAQRQKWGGVADVFDVEQYRRSARRAAMNDDTRGPTTPAPRLDQVAPVTLLDLSRTTPTPGGQSGEARRPSCPGNENQQQAGAQGGGQGSDAGSTAFQAITSQEELNRVIGARINQVKGPVRRLRPAPRRPRCTTRASGQQVPSYRRPSRRAEKAEKDLTPRAQVARLEAALEGPHPHPGQAPGQHHQDELAADADELLADLSATSPAAVLVAANAATPASSVRLPWFGRRERRPDRQERAAAALRQLRGND